VSDTAPTPSKTLAYLHVVAPAPSTIVRGVPARSALSDKDYDPSLINLVPALQAAAIQTGLPFAERTIVFRVDGDRFVTEPPDIAIGGIAATSIKAWMINCISVKTVRAPRLREQLGAVWQVDTVALVNESTLVLRFLYSPAFTVGFTEVFVLSFTAKCFASGLPPANTEFAFAIEPTPAPTPGPSQPPEDAMHSVSTASSAAAAAASVLGSVAGGPASLAFGVTNVAFITSTALCRGRRSRLSFIEHPTGVSTSVVALSDVVDGTIETASTANAFMGALLTNGGISLGAAILFSVLLLMARAKQSPSRAALPDPDEFDLADLTPGSPTRAKLNKQSTDESRLRRAMSAVGYPGRLACLAFFFPVAVKCSVFLFFTTRAPLPLFLAFGVLTAWCLIVAAVGFVLFGSAFRGLYVTRMAWPRRPHLILCGLSTWDWRNVFRAGGKWVDAGRAPAFMSAHTHEEQVAAIEASRSPDTFVRKFRGLFGAYHGDAHYFLMAEVILGAVLGGIDGYAASSGECLGASIAMCVVLAINLLGIVLLRPFAAFANNVFATFVAVVLVALGGMSAAHARTPNGTLLTAILVLGLVCQLTIALRCCIALVVVVRKLSRTQLYQRRKDAALAYDAGIHRRTELLPSNHDIFFRLSQMEPVFGEAAFPHPVVTAYHLRGSRRFYPQPDDAMRDSQNRPPGHSGFDHEGFGGTGNRFVIDDGSEDADFDIALGFSHTPPMLPLREDPAASTVHVHPSPSPNAGSRRMFADVDPDLFVAPKVTMDDPPRISSDGGEWTGVSNDLQHPSTGHTPRAPRPARAIDEMVRSMHHVPEGPAVGIYFTREDLLAGSSFAVPVLPGSRRLPRHVQSSSVAGGFTQRVEQDGIDSDEDL
jgi:hypothetical protein